MKKLFIFLVVSITGVAVYSQSVAINTDGSLPHPSAMLDVKNANKGVLLPRTSTTTRNTIPAVKGLMVYDTTTNSFWFNNGSAWTELGSGGAGFWTASTTHIYNINSGNVGIGTSTPSFDLHIRRINPSIGFYDEDDATSSGSIEGDSTNLVINAYRKPIGLFNQSGDIIMQVNGGAASFTTTAGNVGIGTSSPTGKLHIGTGNVMIGAGTPVTKLHIQSNTAGELLRLDGSSPQINFVSDDVNLAFINITGDDLKMGTLSANNTGKFIIRTNGGDRMQVDENGIVSIGTITPATGYRLNVNGKAICTELKVQLTSNWPDYVFSSSHKRLSLDDLKIFIDKNKHLPNIPSATKMQANGIEVGEMQRLTMEKIEELALYIIELKQEIDDLKKAKQQL